MCGLVYINRIDGKNAVKMATKRYQRQKSRGQSGFGFISLQEGIIQDYLRATTEKSILSGLNEQQANEIFFHHRLPTSTPNFAETAHPIRVSNDLLKYDYYVIHNGVILNDDILKPDHEALGFTYNTEISNEWRAKGGEVIGITKKWNDSEALAIELAIAIDGDTNKIGTRGSIACIILQVEKNSARTVRLLWGRNAGNPLKLDFTRNQFFTLTSEGDGNSVEENVLFSYCYDTKQMDGRKFDFGYCYSYSTGYTHKSYSGQASDSSWSGHAHSWNKSDEDDDDDFYNRFLPAPKKADDLPIIEPDVYDTTAERLELQAERLELEEFLRKLKENEPIQMYDYTEAEAIDRIEEIEQELEKIGKQDFYNKLLAHGTH